MRYVVGVATAALLLTSCTSSGDGPAATPRPSSAGASPALTTGLPRPSDTTTAAPRTSPKTTATYARSPHPVSEQVGYADNGTTVTVHVGGGLRVDLDSTYWTILGSSDSAVLAPAGPVEHVGQGANSSCVPGAGCGSVAQTFTARAAGRAVVSAHRTICGEALACLPGKRTFTVTVIVD